MLSNVLTYLLSTGDEIEQLSASRILKHHKNFRLSINKLKKLNNMWVIESAQNFQFSFDLLENSVLANFLFVQNFDGHFVPCLLVESH